MTESSIPLWLSLIAIASLLQVTMLVVAVVMLARNARKMQKLAADIRREQIAPLVARAHGTIDEVQGVIARVRAYDDDVRRAVGRAGDRVQQVTNLVRARSSPIVGLVRGATAAWSVLVNGRHESTRPQAAAYSRDSRATSAGGTDHARY